MVTLLLEILKADLFRSLNLFQKKMSQGESDMLYSLPTKQARGRDSISSTYDTLVPSQPPGLEELIELQKQVKQGSLTMDEALERFSDWQRVQRGVDSIQQTFQLLFISLFCMSGPSDSSLPSTVQREEKLRQLRASIINNREDDENVYGSGTKAGWCAEQPAIAPSAGDEPEEAEALASKAAGPFAFGGAQSRGPGGIYTVC
ncbi:hypothetical protein JZ751_008612 [Albula glossodonta]|uniref:Uncharacterized protein n=1 Tax=Albula glossodonta TaxID=121402 RepID=A0A8T2P7F1_9TELE|nr:hypothetical protein JZ751_008612 [Albula glossodonta]